MDTKTSTLFTSLVLGFFLQGLAVLQGANPTLHSEVKAIITASDYCEFLNSVATTDLDNLYDEKMGVSSSDLIVRGGEPGSYHYDVVHGKEKTPITFVNDLDGTQYCNWLQRISTSIFLISCTKSDPLLRSNYLNFYLNAPSSFIQQSSGEENASWIKGIIEDLIGACLCTAVGGGQYARSESHHQELTHADEEIISVPTTQEQLVARSKLRALKTRAEQMINPATQKPQFLEIDPSPYRTDFFLSYALRQIVREREKNKGAAHLQKFITVAYPFTGRASDYDRKISEIKRNFQSYLLSKKEGDSPKMKNQVSAVALHDVLRDLHEVRLNDELRQKKEERVPGVLSSEEEQLFSCAEDIQGEKGGGLSLIDQYKIDNPNSASNLNSFFSKYNMSLGGLLGKGSFAEVYPVLSTEKKFSKNKYVFKWIKREIKQDPKVQFWRQQEFALHGLDNIPNVVRSLFFIVTVNAPHNGSKWCLLPADQLKIFGLHLPPDATVKLKGQFMERVPGVNLLDLNKQAELKDNVTKILVVKNIARGLFSALQEMYRHNLLHGDIQPGNIFYDPSLGKTTLFDFGLAQRLRKREKEDQLFHKNPLTGNTTFKMWELARHFRSSRAWQEERHGSEVDFFSYAMILLYITSGDDFSSFLSKASVDPKRSLCPSKEYLRYYLTQARGHHDEPLATEVIFKEHPELKKVIDLAFRISGGGREGEAAFGRLQNRAWLEQEPEG